MTRIYVASLSDYNAGRLHGAWIDLADATEYEVSEQINAMLAASECQPAEEWAIHDAEGLGGLSAERMSVADLCEVAQAIEDYGEIAARAVADGMCEASEVGRYMRDHYAGEYERLEDYAEGTVEMEGWPEVARRYFDWEAFCRDLELGGDVTTIRMDGMLHVFTA